MRSFRTVFEIALLLLIVYDRTTIDKLTSQLTQQLAKSNTVERKRKQIHYVRRDAAREKVFSLLYELNKEQKRIKYLPGELLIEDPGLSQNDQFLDLLDLLFEQNQLVMIEIPDNKNIRQDLQQAGFSSDFISQSKDGQWRVRIKE